MTGPYATIGARLIERGFSALPIMPNSKVPGQLRRGEWCGLSKWREEYSRRLPSRFEIQVWSNSDAGVCVVTGKGSRDLVGVDIDTDDPAIYGAILSVLPPTGLIKRGHKGDTRFYRAPNIDRSASWNINKQRVCDLIGPGRQTVLPPSIHPSTNQPYRWIGTEALEDVDPQDLPELGPEVFDAIAAVLTPLGYNAEADRELAARPLGDMSEKSAHRIVNEMALANLDAWVPSLGIYRCRRCPGGFEAVATWRASNSGTPIEKRKLNLKIHQSGITDFGDGPRRYSAIDLMIAASDGNYTVESAFCFLAEATGFGGGAPATLELTAAKAIQPASAVPALAKRNTALPVLVPMAEPATGEDAVTARAMVLAAMGDWKTDPETGELQVVSAPEGPPDELEPYTRGDHMGVVGDLIDWITATARRPNRVLALGAAVTIVGTLIGRRVAGPTRSGTHLYVVTLAPTGSGKQHSLNCLMRAMTAAKAGQHVGPSEFISMPAVINSLLTRPLALCPQDEFGAFLKRVNSRRASGFEASISKILRSIWGISFEGMATPEWAGRRSEIINMPAVSIYGLSTPGEFYESLQGEDVTNGFLNRFLVLSAGVRAPETVPEMEPGHIPSSLVVGLTDLYKWSGGDLGISRLNDPTMDAKPDVLPWASDQARVSYMDFARSIERRMDKEPELEPFVARCGEIAVRLATIRAAGRWGPGATVDLGDIEWGIAVSSMSAEMVASDALKKMVVEMSHGQVANKVLDVIRRLGGRASRRDVFRALGKSVRSVKDLEQIIGMLAEGGTVSIEKVTPPAGGPPSVWYQAA